MPYIFNPYEIAFCGFSRSGKTTLIEKLIRQLSAVYTIGYVKHDVHGFEMDKEGKDTFRVRQSGARMVSIRDDRRGAVIHEGRHDGFGCRNLLLENDLVFAEGYKNSEIPKIIFIDQDEKILGEIKNGRFHRVIAFTGIKRAYAGLPLEIPYFQRDDVTGIKDLVVAYFSRQAQGIPLNGLVLAGGQSRRMKKDKSLLEYHGKKQTEFCYGLLKPFCAQVFLSNRQDQSDLEGHRGLPQLHDMFTGIGPLGGILTALKTYPDAAWLVLACDLPFVGKGVLERLVQRRNPFKTATAYESAKDNGQPEPLCAIYEPKSIFCLMQFFASGRICPRTILRHSDITLLPPFGGNTLENVNDPAEYAQAIRNLK